MATLSYSQLASAARAGGWSDSKNLSIAVAVAMAESSGNTNAYNGAFGTYGLWQIYKNVHPDIWNPNWTDPAVNAKMAYAVWRQQGWKAWSTYTSGAYLRYLSKAKAAVGGSSSGDLPQSTPVIDIPNPFQPLTDAAKFVTDPHNWMRLGWFVIGGILLVVGFMKITGTGEVLMKTAKSAAAIGVVAA